MQSWRWMLALSCLGSFVSLSADGAETAPQEAAAAPARVPSDVERYAMHYRITIYNTFRTDRAEYARRLAAWESLHSAWIANGLQPAQKQAVVNWLRDATRRSQAGGKSPLPRLPNFAGMSPEHGVAAAAPRTRMILQRPATEATASVSAMRPRLLQPFTPTTPPAVSDSAPNDALPTLPGPQRVAQTPPPAADRQAPAAVTVLRPIAPAAPERVQETAQPPASAETLLPEKTPSRPNPLPAAAIEPPAPVEAPKPVVEPPQPAPEPKPAVEPKPAPAPVELAKIDPPPARPVAPKPAPQVEPAPVVEKQVAAKPAAPQPPAANEDFDALLFDEPRPVDPAEINVVELDARIAGYNQGLKELEDKLLLEKKWDARGLANATSELLHLKEIYADSQLYLPLLDAAQKAQVQEPNSFETAEELLKVKIRTLQIELGAEDSDDSELRWQIDVLNAALRQLADKAKK